MLKCRRDVETCPGLKFEIELCQDSWHWNVSILVRAFEGELNSIAFKWIAMTPWTAKCLDTTQSFWCLCLSTVYDLHSYQVHIPAILYRIIHLWRFSIKWVGVETTLTQNRLEYCGLPIMIGQQCCMDSTWCSHYNECFQYYRHCNELIKMPYTQPSARCNM